MKTKKPLRSPSQPIAVPLKNSKASASPSSSTETSFWWQQPSLLALAYGAFFFLISYFSNPTRPGTLYRLGWYETGYDQSQYYDMTMAIHHGSLGAFQYPVVYPFFGYLGSLLYPSDPFFLPDLLLFSLFIYLSAHLFSFILPKKFAILAASAVLVHATCGMFVMPWTSSLAAPALLVILLAYLAKRLSPAWGAFCGLCVGVMFGTRIADALLGAAVLGLFLIENLRARTGFRFFVAAGASAAGVTTLVLFVNQQFSGLWMGNYYHAAMGQAWCFSCIPWHIYGYVVDPFRFAGSVHPLNAPMIQVLPLFLLAPLGLIFLFKNQLQRRAALGFLAVLMTWMVLYFPFAAVIGPTLKYGSMHYAKILFPILTCCSFFALRIIVQPDSSQIRIAGWYAGITAACLLAITAWFPGKLELPNITVSSSVNPGEAQNAVDGNPATRWNSAAVQTPGMTFHIDFGKPIILDRLVLDTGQSPGDTPRALGIEASTDGKNWREVSTRAGDDEARAGGYYFDPTRVRQMRLTVREARPNVYWSIYEIYAYGWNSPW